MKELTETQKKALNVKKSMCVTASAGTGKTTVLAERYLACLEDPSVLPKNILCLTYTDKAAVEMRDKIEERLRKRVEEVDKPELKKHLIEAVDSFYQARISTFHGFCATVLREFPIEAEVTPGFAIMDEVLKEELVGRTIDSFLKNPPREFREKLTFLYTYVRSFSAKQNILFILAKWRLLNDWFDRFSKDPKAVYDDLLKRYRTRIHTIAEDIRKDPKISSFIEACKNEGYPSGKVTKVLEAYSRFCRSGNFEAEYETLQELSKHADLKEDSMNIRGHTNPSPEGLVYFVDSLRKIKAAIVPIPEYDDKQIVLLTRIISCYCSIVKELYARIEDKKKRRGVMDFDDLICHTRNLMKNKEDVVTQLKERFRYILVDEVQDNDPALTEIIDALRIHNKKDNRLFIVGDLKQSIYKFRGADPEGARNYFNSFRNSLDLDTCFRSLPAIIDAVNAVFPPLFNGDKSGLCYNGVACSRTADHGSVQIIHNEYAEGTKGEIYYPVESEKIAGWIQDAVDNKRLLIGNEDTKHPASYGDIVILEDRGTHLPLLLDKLDAYGIPYRVIKGKQFYASAEVADFLLLLKALVYREDDIALYGALSSPYFGVTPEILAGCWSGYMPLYKRLARYHSPEVQEALKKMKYLRKYALTEPLVAFAHRIVRETGILSVYASTKNGTDKIANLNALLDSISSDPSVSIFTFIDRLEKNIEAKAKDGEMDDEVPEDEANFVRIMTIHASKGLEFPVVILAFSGRKMLENKDYVTADGDLGVGISLYDADGEQVPSLAYKIAKDELNSAACEERERLFYVAMTRAKDHLILSESACCDQYSTTAFMTYFRDAADVQSFKRTDEILGTPKDTGYELHALENWNVINPIPYEEDKRDANQRELDEGTCIHAIFEGKDADLECEKFGFQGREDEFREKYEHFLNSEMMKNEEESFCEVPIVNAEMENLRVDRLVRNKDGSYLIIDYKNGYSDKQNPKLLEEYREKLIKYSECMSDALGMKVPAYLYFILDEVYQKIC